MTSTGDQRSDFRYWLGVALERSARQTSAEWLEELHRSLPESSSRKFPVQVLSDHLGSLLERLFFAVATGRDLSHDQSFVAEATCLARFRRRHGFTSDEIAAELQLLTQRVFERACVLLRSYPTTAEPALVFEMAERLRSSLSSFACLTLEAFRTADREEQRAWSSLLSSFSRTVVHELRNRLSVAVLRAELALSQSAGAQALDRALDSVNEGVEDVSLMITARTAAEALDRHTMPVRELVEQVVEDLSSIADKAGVELEPLPSLPIFHADAIKTYLVLLNLLGSAIRNAKLSQPQGSVGVRAQPLHDVSAWRIDVLVNRQENQRSASNSAPVRGDLKPSELALESAALAAARQAAAQLGGGLWVNGDEHSANLVFSLTIPEPPSGF